MIKLNGGSVEEFPDYSRWSYEGFLEKWRSLWSDKHEPIKWSRTRLQDNDYIIIGFPTEIDPSLAQDFVDSSAFWNPIIGETPVTPVFYNNPININTQFPRCDNGGEFILPARTPFQLLILAEVTAIDGPGNVLGRAGPCVTSGGMPRIGRMRFDVEDIGGLVQSGSFAAVIKHEMGHVVGIGTRWGNLVDNRCTEFNPCNGDPSFTGENAIQGFNELGGTGRLLVANQGNFTYCFLFCCKSFLYRRQWNCKRTLAGINI